MFNVLENINHWNIKLRKWLNIFIIISIIFIHIIVTYQKSIFSEEIKTTYSFISIVILFPLVYDSIKSK